MQTWVSANASMVVCHDMSMATRLKPLFSVLQERPMSSPAYQAWQSSFARGIGSYLWFMPVAHNTQWFNCPWYNKHTALYCQLPQNRLVNRQFSPPG